MKRILINATHNEEVRVALCKGNHLYDFDLENRTREQKKANIYKGHVTRVEPSLEAVFVEYGSKRQGFLPIREIASEYLSGNPREENIRKLIKEGNELIVQVEKEERGNKGAALSTYVSLAGRYLVLMPNNPKGGGISRQISGKLREDMKRMLGNLDLPKGMSVIVRTAGIGKTQEDLQHDLNHLLNIWSAIQDQNKKYASPRLVHQEAGVVTRAVRDYLRDDISEIWIDNEEAFIEAETFIKAVMPTQIEKLRKYTDFEPMFSNFNVERQIETAYQREVRLPSGGSIVIDQTEALVSIDINSAKSTKGADVAETAYNTNLEAADEIARQLRLRDMGGLIVIDFIDMNDSKHQKEVEKRLIEATKYDRARVQFSEISRFGLMEMSRQRLRPSLEESTGYICPRCHGNGMIRDLRSLSLSIMRQIEQTALKERHGEVQAEVPTDVAAFLLNEKRESLVYLEQDSGTRITILPHAHLESPNFNLHFNHQGFAPASYERVTDTQQQENSSLGYEVDWQTAESERPEQQPTRQPRQSNTENAQQVQTNKSSSQSTAKVSTESASSQQTQTTGQQQAQLDQAKPAAVAWLSNLFAPTPEAQMSATVSSADAAQAIEAIVNTGAQSRGAFGQVATMPVAPEGQTAEPEAQSAASKDNRAAESKPQKDSDKDDDNNSDNEKDRRRSRNNRNRNKYDKRAKSESRRRQSDKDDKKPTTKTNKSENHSSESSQDGNTKELPKREPNSKRESRGPVERGERKQPQHKSDSSTQDNRAKREEKGKGSDNSSIQSNDNANNRSGNGSSSSSNNKSNRSQNERNVDPNEVNLRVTEAEPTLKEAEVVHISLEDNKPETQAKLKVKTKTDAKKHSKLEATESDTDRSATPKSSSAGSEQQQDSNKAAVNSEQHKSEANKPLEKTADIKPKVTQPTQESSSVAASTASVKKDKTSNAKPAEQEKQTTTVDDSDSTSLGFDTKALFADRYVAAQKYGQASNDPRLIKASMQQQSKQVEAEEAKPVPVATITGTVGQFIHTHLAQPTMRLAKDGVIICFLAALNAHKETSGGSSKAPAKRKVAKRTADSTKAFSFVNYGYQSLSPSYLQRFAKMTSAVAAHNIEQGKTQVEPTPVGARASNDPRGQHPDYTLGVTANNGTKTAQLVKPEAAAAQLKAASSANSKSAATASAKEVTDTDHPMNGPSAASKVDLLQQSVGDFINQVLGQQGLDIINAGQTETAFLEALNKPFDALLSATESSAPTAEKEKVIESLEHPASALVNEPEAEAISDENIEELSESQLKTKTENPEEEEQEANSSNKTSIESYKSMIETISEQLLPQTGLLNLTSPKVPKARSRKSKEGSKKQADTDNNTNQAANSDSES